MSIQTRQFQARGISKAKIQVGIDFGVLGTGRRPECGKECEVGVENVSSEAQDSGPSRVLLAQQALLRRQLK